MRKYYTIEKTLHTNKECLASMIKTLVSNRKSVDKSFESKTDGKNFLRAESQKKISSVER